MSAQNALPLFSALQVILGGGRRNFLPKWYTDPTTKTVGRRLDGRSLIREWEMDKMRRGVKAAYVTTREELTDVSADTSFVLGKRRREIAVAHFILQ